MQTLCLFQTFENYLFLRRLMCTMQEGFGGRHGGSVAGPGPITGVETEADAHPGPGDSRHSHMEEAEGCVFFLLGGRGCLSRWRGLVILSILESWIRLPSPARRFERLSRAHSDAQRRQRVQTQRRQGRREMYLRVVVHVPTPRSTFY